MYHLALLNGYVCLLKIILPKFPECKNVPQIPLAAIPDKDGPWYLALSLDGNSDCTYFPEMNSEQFKQLRCNGKRELEILFFPGKHWNKRSLSVQAHDHSMLEKFSWRAKTHSLMFVISASSSWPMNTVTLTVLILLAASRLGEKTRAHRFCSILTFFYVFFLILL